MKKTTLISLFIIFTAVGFGLYYLPSKTTDVPATFTTAANPNNVDLAPLVQQNAGHQNKIKELQQENRKLRKQLRAQQTESSPVALPPAEQAAPQQATDLSGDFDKQQQSTVNVLELRAYMSTFSAMSPADIDRNLSNTFAAEAVDYPWAGDHEIKLGRLFAENEKLAEFVPENISCKTTRCRVTVPTRNYEESNQVMENVAQALVKNAVGLAQTTVLTVPDPATGFVDFYIARDSDARLYQ